MAFQNCERLCTLNLPDTVEDIGEMAFRDTAVQNLRVPPLVVTIGLSMVSDCNCLVSLELSERVRRIEDASPGTVLRSLRNIALPSDCTSTALMNCDSLDAVFHQCS